MEKFRENNKRKIILFIAMVVIVVVVLGGITYAFFVPSVQDFVNETLSVTSGDLRLIFRDNSAEITPGINGTWNFGDSIEKEVAIENNGTQDLYARILWENLVNTYLPESLTYTLEEKSSEAGSTYKTVMTTRKNVPQSATASTQELANGLLIPAGKTNIYKITVTLEDLPTIDQTADLNASLITKFTLKQGTELLLVDALLSKRNDDAISVYTDGAIGEMYTFDHVEATQTTGWSEAERRDYRYIGSTPNNWVKFNGEDWRIIGVFTVETSSGAKEQLIKIIRTESIGFSAWDAGNVTEWPSSSLKVLLNEGDYYNRTNTYASTGLNDTAKGQIEEVKWYLGGSSTYENLGGSAYYNFERGEATCVTTGRCSGETRSTNTIAKVGLMYPSDYVYTYANGVDSTCYINGFNCRTSEGGTPANGWLYNSSYNQYTMSPYTRSGGVFYMHSSGFMDYTANVYMSVTINPTAYLKSSVKLVNGDGSQENPYILG